MKFAVPTIANGKVYVGAQGRLTVYGYLKTASAPAISPDGGTFTAATDVSLSGAAGEEIRYTLDGTDPSPDSALYTAAFSLTGSATVKARAFAGGKNPSPVAAASFTVNIPPPELFIRGDATLDGVLDISDAVAVLNFLYLGGSLSCEDAADFDANGSLDITDPIGIVTFLYLGGDPPSPPYPQPGPEPSGNGSSPGCVQGLPSQG